MLAKPTASCTGAKTYFIRGTGIYKGGAAGILNPNKVGAGTSKGRVSPHKYLDQASISDTHPLTSSFISMPGVTHTPLYVLRRRVGIALY